VFSGVLGSLRRKEFTSIGVVVNTAYRLQALALAGEIMLCRETYDKVLDRFSAQALGPVRVKGMAEPIEVYRIRA
jgi:adenylate cyclase